MLGVLCGMQSEAAFVKGPGISVAVSGARREIADVRLKELVEAGAAILVSFGTAGALSDALPAGSIVLGNEVLDQAGNRWPIATELCDQLAKMLPDARRESVLGVDRPILEISGKHKARLETGAAIADMESHLTAKFADKCKLPFLTLRVVLDDAQTSVPQALFEAVDRGGNIRLSIVIAALLSSKVSLRQLLALRSQHSASVKSLFRCGAALRRFCN